MIFVYARHRQNQLIARQRLMQEEFQRQLMKVQIEVQEHTCATLSQELHDNIGGLLTSTRILLNLTGRSLHEPPDTLGLAEETVEKAIHDLRALAKSLNKEWLDQFDLVENLQMEVDRINAARIVRLEFLHADCRLPLATESQVMLFRIIQEGIQNCLKHARASEIRIRLDVAGEELCVTIADDGNGFDTRLNASGVGLLNMRYRTRLIGGVIHWDSAPGAGTEVGIRLPMPV